MPDSGRSRHEDYLVDLPKQRPPYPPLPWVCPNSTMINVYFEVLKAPLLDRLPPEFCRTSPPYCRLSIFDHPESPVGPFRDAILALGCRLNMMPAAFVAVSIDFSAPFCRFRGCRCEGTSFIDFVAHDRSSSCSRGIAWAFVSLTSSSSSNKAW